MDSPVAFTDVAARIAHYGPLASLITVTADAKPHVGTVLVEVGDGQLEVRVGNGTRGNVGAHPAVTLAWLLDGADYQLLIDGVATVGDEKGPDGLYPMAIRVDHGILHRLAGRADAGPSCLALSDAPVR